MALMFIVMLFSADVNGLRLKEKMPKGGLVHDTALLRR